MVISIAQHLTNKGEHIVLYKQQNVCMWNHENNA